MKTANRTLLLLIQCLALLCAGLSGAQASSDPWVVWQQDGVQAIMRHATAPGFGDPEGFRLGQCNTQRNLSAEGRKEAEALGEAIRKQGIRLTAVYSSQWCRCLHTAQALNLGKVQELPVLNSFFQERGRSAEQTVGLKKHLASLNAKDKVLYVTHQVNTTALTGVYPESGEIILFRMNADGQATVLGKIRL